MTESAAASRIRKKSSRGSTIVESVICMLVLCLVLFGLMQVYLFFITQEVLDYSAFFKARSMSVGFNKTISDRQAFIRSASVSGKRLYPDDWNSHSNSAYAFSSGVGDRFWQERRILWHYARNEIHVKYEYWDLNSGGKNTRFMTDGKYTDRSVTATAELENFPANLPFAGAFYSDPSVNLKSECELGNNARMYLE